MFDSWPRDFVILKLFGYCRALGVGSFCVELRRASRDHNGLGCDLDGSCLIRDSNESLDSGLVLVVDPDNIYNLVILFGVLILSCYYYF